MSETDIEQFDALLKDGGPAAIVLKRRLRPVEGDDAWIFPPTFAQSESADEDDEGRGGNYQIDDLPDDPRRNVCLIDSVGSQANRIEPIFKQAPYSSLVPQISVRLKDGDTVNLLDAGHRAADAIIRFSTTYGPRINEAFKQYQKERDCTALLSIAPTSLVFGVWDSRATGAKIQRIVRSVIRAYNVVAIRRSATYEAAYDYVGAEVIDSNLDKGSGKNNHLSQEGFKYSLATKTHGGITARAGIYQEAVINLAALRVLSEAMSIRRYLLGLSLVALSYRDQNGFNLREGCLLCAATKAEFDGNWRIIYFDGTELDAQEKTSPLWDFTHQKALAFAQQTIRPDGGINISQPASDIFDKDTAQKWLAIDKKERKTLAKSRHPAAAIAHAAGKKAAASAKKESKKGESAPGVTPAAEDSAATREDEATKPE